MLRPRPGLLMTSYIWWRHNVCFVSGLPQHSHHYWSNELHQSTGNCRKSLIFVCDLMYCLDIGLVTILLKARVADYVLTTTAGLHYTKGMREYQCPLNDLFHGVLTVILNSQMVISKIFITVAVSWNVGASINFFN